MEEAITVQDDQIFKVTKQNGDEFIFHSLVKEGNEVVGLNEAGDERTALNKNDIKEIRTFNKGSLSFFGILGWGILIASGVVVATML